MSPLQGFDQVIAVTQNHINASLDTRFQLDPDLAELKFKSKWGSIEADMAPATVRLFLGDTEPHKVRFCVNLTSGTCKWNVIDDTGDELVVKTMTADIKNWTLAFTVNLGLEQISQIPDDIKKKITVPGSYSLSQLLLDFTTADLSSFDLKLSNLPGLKPPLGEDPDRDDVLGDSIKKYLGSLHKTGHNILGYAITVPDPKVANPVAPSFPPTSVVFQTMGAKGTTGHGLDCFLFLEMTDKERKPPSPPFVSWTQNWVDEGKSGSMVISKANFWDRFFVVNSTFLNRMALEMLNRLAHSLEGSADNSDQWDVPWEITGQEPSGSSLAWKSKKTMSVSYDWSHSEPEHTVGLYDKKTRSFNTTVDVTLDTGTNAITMKAYSHVYRKYINIYPAGRVWIKETYEIDARIDWGYSFTLASVTDGTLAMSVTLVPAKPKCTVSSHADANIGRFWAPSNSELSTWAQEDLQKRVDENNTLVADVTKALKTHSQFVFPGSGTFFMRDPRYNSDGDLVVNLQYKQE